jgi:hypothetical protein
LDHDDDADSFIPPPTFGVWTNTTISCFIDLIYLIVSAV